jgi:hypothetical protein
MMRVEKMCCVLFLIFLLNSLGGGLHSRSCHWTLELIVCKQIARK